MELTEQDSFFVLACDGIWNSMTSQEVVTFINKRIEKGDSLSHICEELLEACLSPDKGIDENGCDNMTVIIVLLSHGKPLPLSPSSSSSSSSSSQSPPSKANKTSKSRQVKKPSSSSKLPRSTSFIESKTNKKE